jgi:hypothetical protein
MLGLVDWSLRSWSNMTGRAICLEDVGQRQRIRCRFKRLVAVITPLIFLQKSSTSIISGDDCLDWSVLADMRA